MLFLFPDGSKDGRKTAIAILACILAGCSFPVMPEPIDPFSTRGLTASSVSDSVHRPLAMAPCGNVPVSGIRLTLADVVERALCNNPQTREAWANARVQAAQVGVSQSAYLPTISVGASQNRSRIEGGGSRAPGATNLSQHSLNASLNYLLYDFGGRAAALDNARQVLTALNLTQDATIQSVFLAAVQAYYQFFSTRAAVESLEQAEKSALESVHAATSRHKVGTGTLADRLQAETAHSQATLLRIQAEGEARNARGVLANVMGEDANRDFAIVSPTLHMAGVQFERDIAGLIEEARNLRPDLAAAKAQVNAAKASVEVAKAAGMPTISLTSNVSESNFGIFAPASNASVGVSVNFPLFTGFNNTYRIRAAETQVEARLAQSEKLSQQIALDVWKAYQGVVTGTQAVKSSLTLLSGATQSERVARGRYQAGVGNILDLLLAQASLANARMQNIQAIYNWHIAKAVLAQSMGMLDFPALAPGKTSR